MPLDPLDVDFICRLIAEGSGNVLVPAQSYLIEGKLQSVARNAGLNSVEELIQTLRRSGSISLRTRVVEAMTINETSFFRDMHPFEVLQKTIVPSLIAARKNVKQFSIWCAASSSGQEPYSIVMMLKEYFPELADWTVRVLASDISDEMLMRSRDGIYSQFEVNRGLPARFLAKYFCRTGMNWQIQEALRRQIEFQKINLNTILPLLPTFDIVSIRNVMIYFDQPAKQAILQRIRSTLHPNGYLILGGSETLLGLNTAFRRDDSIKGGCYRPC